MKPEEIYFYQYYLLTAYRKKQKDEKEIEWIKNYVEKELGFTDYEIYSLYEYLAQIDNRIENEVPREWRYFINVGQYILDLILEYKLIFFDLPKCYYVVERR